ncbi:NAD/NADP octopine/nopaline dehydrogenase family protein [Actinophytocola sp.]|uniref:NAD/NADP octopine/nopaline dehydrogenase family protein n=1 Tax=Actinophytocola sp. TaxID=1872138 RepID=UPI002ED51D2F
MVSHPLRVLVCGTGAASHVLATLISSRPDVELSVFTRSPDKAREWTNILRHERLKATLGSGRAEIAAGSFLVTSDPAQAARGCDIAILSLPAFVHHGYLAALAPHLEEGCVVVGLPGQCGFGFEVRKMLGRCTVLDFTSLPWVCRLERFGTRVHIAGIKETVAGAIRETTATSRIVDPVQTVQSLLGDPARLVVSGHPLGVTLGSINATVHPPIMYSRWSDWDGAPLDHEPLFYESIDERAAWLISEIGQEIIAIARRIMSQHPAVDLSGVIDKYDWYLKSYGPGIADKSSLMTAIRTNASYAGIAHPMIEVTPGKFIPDFSHRFLAEDVPFGLIVSRGIGEIVGVPTPTIDLVVRWAQELLGHEYLTRHGLTGLDLAGTRCPQRYGFVTLHDILDLDEQAALTRRS